eukprot:TRINITY_DN275_c0_g4_i1.p2 TRINITY_DN275_c0_g4~~TRINITY_DN275_c0_g4_i1.p2  ORF type:complete len:173 (+),score=9.66 TRINITY_DN275_c0_g4_i1:212-730(+)
MDIIRIKSRPCSIVLLIFIHALKSQVQRNGQLLCRKFLTAQVDKSWWTAQNYFSFCTFFQIVHNIVLGQQFILVSVKDLGIIVGGVIRGSRVRLIARAFNQNSQQQLHYKNKQINVQVNFVDGVRGQNWRLQSSQINKQFFWLFYFGYFIQHVVVLLGGLFLYPQLNGRIIE